MSDKSPKTLITAGFEPVHWFAEVGHATSVQLPAILQTLLKNHDFLSWREKPLDQLAQMEGRSD